MDSHVYAQLTAALSTEATLTVADDFYRNRGGGGGRGPPGPPGGRGPPGDKGDRGPQGRRQRSRGRRSAWSERTAGRRRK